MAFNAGAMRLPRPVAVHVQPRQCTRRPRQRTSTYRNSQLMRTQKIVVQYDGAARQFASPLRLQLICPRCVREDSRAAIPSRENVDESQMPRSHIEAQKMPQGRFDQTGFPSSVTGEVTTRKTRSTRPELEIACSTPGGRKMKSCFLTTWLLPAISISPSPSST